MENKINFILKQQQQVDVDGINLHMKEFTKTGMTLVECGCFTGASTLELAQYVKQCKGKMYCVDAWKTMNEDCVLNELFAKHDILRTFRNNIRIAGYEDIITPIVSDIVAASSLFADNSVDCFFLDGGHLYKDIIPQMEAWFPKIKMGGLIMGHDYTVDYHGINHDYMIEHSDVDHIQGVHYGVIRMVKEYFPTAKKDGRVFFYIKDKEKL